MWQDIHGGSSRVQQTIQWNYFQVNLFFMLIHITEIKHVTFQHMYSQICIKILHDDITGAVLSFPREL